MFQRWHSVVMRGFALCGCIGLSVPALAASTSERPYRQYTRALWTQAQGLPQDSVRAIEQTPDGYLWLATNEGLSRFDGYEFVTFSHDSGNLPSNNVVALESGGDGSLWIGTTDGLIRYHSGRFQTFTSKDGLPSNSIRSLVEDQSGTLWIVAGMYLARYQEGRFTTFSMQSLSPVRGAMVVYEDREHQIWLAGVDGVIKWQVDHFVKVLGPEQLEGHVALAVIRDRSGTLWLGSTAGMIKLQANGVLERFPGLGNRRNQVRAFLEDHDGNIWAGSEGGLNRLEGGKVLAWDLSGDIQLRALRSLYQDREGNLWVATYSGLNRFSDAGFSIYGSAEGLPAGVPDFAYHAPDGQVWVAYNGDGLFTSDGKSIRKFSTKDGLTSDAIFSLRKTPDGDLLISTSAGLSRLHDGRFSNVPIRGAPIHAVDDALQDREGRIWFAATSGLYRLEGGQAIKIVDGDIVTPDFPGVLAEAPDGAIWYGVSGRGLWKIDADGSARLFTVADGLSSIWIRAVYQGPDGSLWVGTRGGGLNEYRDSRFYTYNVKAGILADNVGSHIEDDGRGSLWVQTSRGVCRISKQQLRNFAAKRISTLTPINYFMQDRLRNASPSNDLARVMTLPEQASRIWFATSRGLASIDPADEAAKTAMNEPAVQIVEMTVDNRNVNVKTGPRLDPGPRRVQIRYLAIHLSAPEQVRYAYKLEGIDRDWVYAGARRELNYANLPHGHFSFRARAWISGQEPSEAVLSIEVMPYFYERRYFILLSATLLALSLYGVYLMRLRQVERSFTLVLDERTRLAREIHDTLAQGFVGISAQLKAAAIEFDSDLSAVWQHITTARNMSRHSLTEARRSMRELREPPHDDLASAVAATVRHWRASSSIAVGLTIRGAVRQLPSEIDKNLLRIAQESLANSVKHSRACSINVELEYEEKTLQIVIRDDGEGFEPSDNLALAEGHFGLVGMRERAERIGADFQIHSKPGEGTQICVNLTIPPAVPEKARRTLHVPDWARALWGGVR